MSAPVGGDPWTRWLGQLPHWVAVQVHHTDAAMDSLLLAMANGWQLDRLAAECARDLADVELPGAVVLTRLRHASREKPGPERKRTASVWKQPLPWCGLCDDPRTRWIENDAGQVVRCPRCWTAPPRT